MPHQRYRYLKAVLQKSLGAAPILGILGQRQTGKTTLAEETSVEYSSLDDADQLELVLKSPKNFIENRGKPFAIDECQQSPPLFPALKEHVRKHKAMGQYILTGSVRFTSVEEIKESLTGRMIELELLPLCLTELHGRPLTDLARFLEAKDLAACLRGREPKSAFSTAQIQEFLLKGGLPGICFLRSEDQRVRKTRSHIKTILDRDLRTVTKTTLDYLSIKTFLEEIALQQGDVFDLSKAARGARIALNSARKLLSGLEAVFLVRVLSKQGRTSGKLVYFEDQGMATFLLKERGFSPVAPNAADLNRFLFQQLNAQMKYASGFQGTLFSFRLKSGVLMDFVLATKGGFLGYSVGTGEVASAHQIQSAQSFLKAHPSAQVLLLHLGDRVRALDARIVEAPLGLVV